MVEVDLGADEQGAREPALGVAAPASPHQQAQRRAAQTAVQVETVRGAERAEPPGEVTQRLAGLEGHDAREIGVVGDERGHGPLGDVDQLGLGVAAAEGAHERRRQQDVPDGAEAHQQNGQHAANVSARCPASPVGRERAQLFGIGTAIRHHWHNELARH